MRARHRFLQRLHHRHAGIHAREELLPFKGRSGNDDGGDCLARLERIHSVIQKLRRLQHPQEVLPKFLFQRCSSQKAAVARAVNLIPRSAACHEVAARHRPLASSETIAKAPIHKGKQIVRHRNVDQAPGSVSIAGAQCEQNIHHGRISAPGDVCDKRIWKARSAIHASGQRQQAALGLVIEIMRRHAGQRPLLPPSRDGAIDKAWIHRPHGLVAETEPIHHTRAELLDQNIGRTYQCDCIA